MASCGIGMATLEWNKPGPWLVLGCVTIAMPTAAVGGLISAQALRWDGLQVSLLPGVVALAGVALPMTTIYVFAITGEDAVLLAGAIAAPALAVGGATAQLLVNHRARALGPHPRAASGPAIAWHARPLGGGALVGLSGAF